MTVTRPMGMEGDLQAICLVARERARHRKLLEDSSEDLAYEDSNRPHFYSGKLFRQNTVPGHIPIQGIPQSG